MIYSDFAPSAVEINSLGIGLLNYSNIQSLDLKSTEYLVVGEQYNAGNNADSRDVQYSMIVNNDGVAINTTRRRFDAVNEGSIKARGLYVDNDIICDGNIIAKGLQFANITIDGFNQEVLEDIRKALEVIQPHFNVGNAQEDGTIVDNIYTTSFVTIGNNSATYQNSHPLNVVASANNNIVNTHLSLQNPIDNNQGERAKLRIGMIGESAYSPAVISTTSGMPLEFHVGRSTTQINKLYVNSPDHPDYVTNADLLPAMMIDTTGSIGIGTADINTISYNKRIKNNAIDSDINIVTEKPKIEVIGSAVIENLITYDYFTKTNKHLDDIYVRQQGLTFRTENIIPGDFTQGIFRFNSNLYVGYEGDQYTLEVNNKLLVNGDMQVTDLATFRDVSIDNATFNNATTFDHDIYVNQDLTLGGNLAVNSGDLFVSNKRVNVVDLRPAMVPIDLAKAHNVNESNILIFASSDVLNFSAGSNLVVPGRLGVGVLENDEYIQQFNVIKRMQKQFEVMLEDASMSESESTNPKIFMGHRSGLPQSYGMDDRSFVINTNDTQGLHNIYFFPGVDLHPTTINNIPTLAIHQNNKVGINTSDPKFSLDVNGEILCKDLYILDNNNIERKTAIFILKEDPYAQVQDKKRDFYYMYDTTGVDKYCINFLDKDNIQLKGLNVKGGIHSVTDGYYENNMKLATIKMPDLNKKTAYINNNIVIGWNPGDTNTGSMPLNVRNLSEDKYNDTIVRLYRGKRVGTFPREAKYTGLDICDYDMPPLQDRNNFKWFIYKNHLDVNDERQVGPLQIGYTNNTVHPNHYGMSMYFDKMSTSNYYIDINNPNVNVNFKSRSTMTIYGSLDVRGDINITGNFKYKINGSDAFVASPSAITSIAGGSSGTGASSGSSGTGGVEGFNDIVIAGKKIAIFPKQTTAIGHMELPNGANDSSYIKYLSEVGNQNNNTPLVVYQNVADKPIASFYAGSKSGKIEIGSLDLSKYNYAGAKTVFELNVSKYDPSDSGKSLLEIAAVNNVASPTYEARSKALSIYNDGSMSYINLGSGASCHNPVDGKMRTGDIGSIGVHIENVSKYLLQLTNNVRSPVINMHRDTSDANKFWMIEAPDDKNRFVVKHSESADSYMPDDSKTHNVLVLTNDDKVGINTDDPEYTLDIKGTFDETSLNIANRYSDFSLNEDYATIKVLNSNLQYDKISEYAFVNDTASLYSYNTTSNTYFTGIKYSIDPLYFPETDIDGEDLPYDLIYSSNFVKVKRASVQQSVQFSSSNEFSYNMNQQSIDLMYGTYSCNVVYESEDVPIRVYLQNNIRLTPTIPSISQTTNQNVSLRLNNDKLRSVAKTQDISVNDIPIMLPDGGFRTIEYSYTNTYLYSSNASFVLSFDESSANSRVEGNNLYTSNTLTFRFSKVLNEATDSMTYTSTTVIPVRIAGTDYDNYITTTHRFDYNKSNAYNLDLIANIMKQFDIYSEIQGPDTIIDDNVESSYDYVINNSVVNMNSSIRFLRSLPYGAYDGFRFDSNIVVKNLESSAKTFNQSVTIPELGQTFAYSVSLNDQYSIYDFSINNNYRQFYINTHTLKYKPHIILQNKIDLLNDSERIFGKVNKIYSKNGSLEIVSESYIEKTTLMNINDRGDLHVNGSVSTANTVYANNIVATNIVVEGNVYDKFGNNMIINFDTDTFNRSFTVASSNYVHYTSNFEVYTPDFLIESCNIDFRIVGKNAGGITIHKEDIYEEDVEIPDYNILSIYEKDNITLSVINGGRVGIKVAKPVYDLEVNGDIGVRDIYASSVGGDGDRLYNVNLRDRSTSLLEEGSNLYFTSFRVAEIVNASNVDTCNYIASVASNLDKTSNAISTRITELDSNMSNYVANVSNLLSSNLWTASNNIILRMDSFDINMSNYVDWVASNLVTTSNEISTRITELDSNMSNWASNNFASIDTRISTLTADDIDDTNTSNKFIRNHTYEHSLIFTSNLEVRGNLTVIGDSVIILPREESNASVFIGGDTNNVSLTILRPDTLIDIMSVGNYSETTGEGNNDIFHITNLGYVGIGTYPNKDFDYKLTVSGTLYAEYLKGDGSLMSNVYLSDKTTDDLEEGASRLYFTSTRVAEIVNASNVDTCNYISSVASNLDSTSNTISTLVYELDSNISNYVNDLSSNIESTSNTISTRITELDSNISNYVNDLSSNLASTSNTISTLVYELDSNMSNYVKDLSSNIESTSNTISTLVYELDTNMSNYVKDLSSNIESTSNTISTLVYELDSYMSNWASNTFANIDTRFNNLTTDDIDDTGSSKKYIVNDRYDTLTLQNLTVEGQQTIITTNRYETENLYILSNDVGPNDLGPALKIRQENAGDDIALFENNGGQIFKMTSNGNVAIGNHTPVEKLDVKGKIKVSQGINNLTYNQLEYLTSIDKPLGTLFSDTSNYVDSTGSNLSKVITDASRNASNYVETTSNNIMNSLKNLNIKGSSEWTSNLNYINYSNVQVYSDSIHIGTGYNLEPYAYYSLKSDKLLTVDSSVNKRNIIANVGGTYLLDADKNDSVLLTSGSSMRLPDEDWSRYSNLTISGWFKANTKNNPNVLLNFAAASHNIVDDSTNLLIHYKFTEINKTSDLANSGTLSTAYNLIHPAQNNDANYNSPSYLRSYIMSDAIEQNENSENYNSGFIMIYDNTNYNIVAAASKSTSNLVLHTKGYDFSEPPSITISFFYKRSEQNNIHPVLYTINNNIINDKIKIVLDFTDKINFKCFNYTFDINVTINDDLMRHYLFVVKDKKVSFYLNGTLYGTKLFEDSWIRTDAIQGLVINNTTFDNNNRCRGYLGDFRIYNRALLAKEITQLYNNVFLNEVISFIPNLKISNTIVSNQPKLTFTVNDVNVYNNDVYTDNSWQHIIWKIGSEQSTIKVNNVLKHTISYDLILPKTYNNYLGAIDNIGDVSVSQLYIFDKPVDVVTEVKLYNSEPLRKTLVDDNYFKDYTKYTINDINKTITTTSNVLIDKINEIKTSGSSSTTLVDSQWKVKNNNLYYLDGNVGFGTSNVNNRVEIFNGDINIISGKIKKTTPGTQDPKVYYNTSQKSKNPVTGAVKEYYVAFTETEHPYEIEFLDTLECELFMIGGGGAGGGGADYIGAGGGAGAYYYNNKFTFSAGTYSFKVGMGGTTTTDYIPSAGGDTFIQQNAQDITITGNQVRCKGGGYGGYNGTPIGGNGGCGGGGAFTIISATAPNNTIVVAGGSSINDQTVGIGYIGGKGIAFKDGGTIRYAGGGGGGISGYNTSNDAWKFFTAVNAGNGGEGLGFTLTGIRQFYGGGGGGSESQQNNNQGGSGGSLIGGNGLNYVPKESDEVTTKNDGSANAGIANTGSGGGGGFGSVGGNGGSGIIIIRYVFVDTTVEDYAPERWKSPDKYIAIDEKFISYTDGNVGIGTNNPGTYKLNVAGKVLMTSNVEISGDVTMTSNLKIDSKLDVGGGIVSSNSIAIGGGHSATQLLHLQRKDQNNYVKIDAGNANTNAGIMLTNHGSQYGYAMRYETASSNLYISKQSDNLAYDNLITITSNGNMNISGSLDIRKRLNLDGPLASPVGPTGSPSEGSRIHLADEYLIGVDSNVLWQTVPNGASHKFYTGSNIAFTIGSNIGIGTGVPQQLLHLQRDNSNNFIKIDASDNNTAGIMLTSSKSNNGYAIRYDANASNLYIGKQLSASDGGIIYDNYISFSNDNKIDLNVSEVIVKNKLSVGGNITWNNYTIGTDANSLLYSTPSGPEKSHKFYGGTNVLMTIGSNIGIGVNVPTETLHIQNAGKDNYIKIHSGAQNKDAGLKLSVFENNTSNEYIIRYNGASNQMQFLYDTCNLMSMSKTGNVGIGKTPVYKMDVDGTVNADQFYLKGKPLSFDAPPNVWSSNVAYDSLEYRNIQVLPNEIREVNRAADAKDLALFNNAFVNYQFRGERLLLFDSSSNNRMLTTTGKYVMKDFRDTLLLSSNTDATFVQHNWSQNSHLIISGWFKIEDPTKDCTLINFEQKDWQKYPNALSSVANDDGRLPYLKLHSGTGGTGGTGVIVGSATSSDQVANVFTLFNNDLGTSFTIAGKYTNGEANTVAENFPGYAGQWIMVNVNSSIILKQIRIYINANESNNAPGNFRIYAAKHPVDLADRNYDNFTQIYETPPSGAIYNIENYATVNLDSNTTPYTVYALVVNKLKGNVQNLAFTEWELYGVQNNISLTYKSNKHLRATINNTSVWNGDDESAYDFSILYPNKWFYLYWNVFNPTANSGSLQVDNYDPFPYIYANFLIASKTYINKLGDIRNYNKVHIADFRIYTSDVSNDKAKLYAPTLPYGTVVDDIYTDSILSTLSDVNNDLIYKDINVSNYIDRKVSRLSQIVIDNDSNVSNYVKWASNVVTSNLERTSNVISTRITNLSTVYAPLSHTHTINQVVDTSNLFNNNGKGIGDYKAFSNIPTYGFWHIDSAQDGPILSNTYEPNVSELIDNSTRFFNITQGSGLSFANNEYVQYAMPYKAKKPYLSIRYKDSDKYHPWQRICAGLADKATKLEVGRSINGVNFDGSGDIEIVDTNWSNAALRNPNVLYNNLAQQIGIGTNNPDSECKLHIVGRTRFDGKLDSYQNGLGGGERLILQRSGLSDHYSIGVNSNEIWYGVPPDKYHTFYQGANTLPVIKIGSSLDVTTSVNSFDYKYEGSTFSDALWERSSDGLVAWYRFNNDSNKMLLDNSGNGYNLTNTTNVKFSSDVKKTGNGSAYFDVNSYLTIPTLNQLSNSSVSFAFWINVAQSSASQHILHLFQDPNNYVSINTENFVDTTGALDDRFRLNFGFVNQIPLKLRGDQQVDKDSFIKPDNKLDYGTWYNIVWIIHNDAGDNANAKWYIYLNGNNIVVDNPMKNFVNSSWEQRLIGAKKSTFGTGYENHYKGYIDDFRIYKRALTATEVKGIYNNRYVNNLYTSGGVGIGKSLDSSYKVDVDGVVNASGFKINGEELKLSDWTTTSSNIYTSSNVSIGKSQLTNGYRLDVDGDVYVVGAVRATGDVLASFSDMRLKTIVADIDNPLDKIMNIKTFKYVPNELAHQLNVVSESNKDTINVGVSAQTVQDVLPEVVTLAPFDMMLSDSGKTVSVSGSNYLTVSYDRMVPLLIECIKELKKEIDDLKRTKNL
jgi:hypothetical protein